MLAELLDAGVVVSAVRRTWTLAVAKNSPPARILVSLLLGRGRCDVQKRTARENFADVSGFVRREELVARVRRDVFLVVAVVLVFLRPQQVDSGLPAALLFELIFVEAVHRRLNDVAEDVEQGLVTSGLLLPPCPEEGSCSQT